MRYLIITDIHGGIDNLTKVLKNEKFDKLLLLGDILPHGPRNDLPSDYKPKEVISLLNNIKEKIIAVRGNCDAEVDDMVLEFPILNLAMLEVNGKSIYLTHGHKINKDNHLNTTNSVILYGHTHITRVDYVESNIYLNIGSITLPKDNTACYAVLENSIITVYSINKEVILTINF